MVNFAPFRGYSTSHPSLHLRESIVGVVRKAETGCAGLRRVQEVGMAKVGVREQEGGADRPVVSGADKNGGNVNRVAKHSGGGIGYAVEDGARRATGVCIVGERGAVFARGPKVMTMRIAEESQIREGRKSWRSRQRRALA